MRAFFAGLLLGLLCLNAQGAPIQYGVAAEVGFCLYDYATPNEKEVTLTFEAADVKVSQSGTEANSTNAPTDNGDCFDITLTAAETDTAWVHLFVDDDDNVWAPIDLHFETYGDVRASDKTRGMASGMLSSATATTAVFVNPAANNIYNKATLMITCGVGAGQRAYITASTQAAGNVTVNLAEAWTTTPDSTSCFMVSNTQQALVACSASGVCDGNQVQINGSAIAAANQRLDYDGTGYNKVNSTLGTVTNLSSTALTAIKNIQVETAGGGFTLGCAMAIIASYAAGTWSQTGAVATYRDPSGTSNRIVGTISATGRSGMTITCP